MSSEKKLAIKGAIWTIASYGSSQIIRFASNLILTRLLLPELFGLVGLAYVFITGVNLFTDIRMYLLGWGLPINKIAPIDLVPIAKLFQ